MVMTIDPGAWDIQIKCAYEAGFILAVIKDERVVKAYQAEKTDN